MIVTRTPLRISLVGGGTDMPSFYSRATGAVVSFAINKYVYVAVNDKFDGRLRVSYSKTENVDDAADLEHDLVRACLDMFKIHSGLEIVSIADIPGGGTGLGSSSSFTVGLITALDALCNKGRPTPPAAIAEMAFEVESRRAGHTLGKQDQYAAAIGGMNLFKFWARSVEVTSLDTNYRKLEKNFLLFYTGITRQAEPILARQSQAYDDDKKFRYGQAMSGMAQVLASNILMDNFKTIGLLLDQNWQLKRGLHSGVSSIQIDEWYDKAMAAGAQGGKLCGAGGGGFLLFYASPRKHKDIESALGLRRVPFRIESEGSKVIYRS